jgi:hypothetical protein
MLPPAVDNLPPVLVTLPPLVMVRAPVLVSVPALIESVVTVTSLMVIVRPTLKLFSAEPVTNATLPAPVAPMVMLFVAVFVVASITAVIAPVPMVRAPPFRLKVPELRASAPAPVRVKVTPVVTLMSLSVTSPLSVTLKKVNVLVS